MTLPVYDSAEVRRPLYTEFRNFWKHRGLLKLLVTRDLTVRYKRSVLGVGWTVINPLLTAGIMYIVFAQLFKARFPPGEDIYVLYLLAGVLFMGFFSQGVLATGVAIRGAAGILTKVYVPAEVFALATSLAALVNFAIGLIPLFVVQLIVGNGIPGTVWLVPLVALAMLALVTGLGLLVASAAVYFNDVLDITRVGIQLVTYLTPVFWPASIVPDRFLPLLYANPLYAYLDVFRALVYRGTMPPAWEIAAVAGSSVGLLAIGVWVFSKVWATLVSQL